RVYQAEFAHSTSFGRGEGVQTSCTLEVPVFVRDARDELFPGRVSECPGVKHSMRGNDPWLASSALPTRGLQGYKLPQSVLVYHIRINLFESSRDFGGVSDRLRARARESNRPKWP